MKTLKEFVIEQINDLSSEQLIELNNTYCRENNIEGEIYENDDDLLNEHFSSISDAVRAAIYGDYNYSHDYVRFNGYANRESLTSVDTSDLCELVEVIAKYAIDNQEDFDMLDFNIEEEED